MSTLQDFAKAQLAPQSEPTFDLPQQTPDSFVMPGQAEAPVANAPAPQPGLAEGGMPPPVPPPPVVPPIVPSMNAPVQEAIAGYSAPLPENNSTLHRIANNAAKDNQTAQADMAGAVKASENAAQEKARLVGVEADQMRPVDARELEENRARQQQLQQQHDQQQAVLGKAAADYGATVDDISKKVANQPKDIWGATGANKVSGILGLIMGTFGGITDGKNAAVERLDKMREQNLAQQKFEYEMLRGKANMQNNLYAMYRNKGLDDATSSASVHANFLDGIAAQAKTILHGTAPGKANADAAATIADLEQKAVAFKQAGAAGAQQTAFNVLKQQQLEKAHEDQMNLEYAKLAAKQPKTAYDMNAIAGDVQFPLGFAKGNAKVVDRFQQQLQSLKEAVSQHQQYVSTEWTEPGKRTGLRATLAGSLAAVDVGSTRPSGHRVTQVEHETGADPFIHLPILGNIGQKGVLSTDMDGRIEQAVRTRVETLARGFQAAGGVIPPNGDFAKIMRLYNVDLGSQRIGENPEQVRGDIRTTANAILDRSKKPVPASKATQFTYPSGV